MLCEFYSVWNSFWCIWERGRFDLCYFVFRCIVDFLKLGGVICVGSCVVPVMGCSLDVVCIGLDLLGVVVFNTSL